MERSIQISLILFIVLGLGLVYVNYQINSVQDEIEGVREMNVELQDQIGYLDNLMLEVGVTIDNGTSSMTETIRLIKGASALEALERVAKVGTSYNPTLGVWINSINGIKNSKQTFWMIYRLENNSEWKQVDVSVDSYKLIDGDNIKFSYEKPSY